MNDKSSKGFADWPFLVVHLWGETPHGTWTLKVNNKGSGSVRLISWHLAIYGTQDYPTADSTTTQASRYTCSCQCPRGSNSGYAYSTVNSLAGCVNACKAVSSNPCISSNTYACLGTDCAYSDSYTSTTTQASRYMCTCECPRGASSGYAYSTVNSAAGCVDACKAVLPNRCLSKNTYACLGTNCAYSDSYNFKIPEMLQTLQKMLGM
ncbi:unnamed protein product [Adineta steineri]|uniref:P/Homo B domain-containing protein n=1 Tax=Adineta steineri TaxID=433720 RepID=A0A813XBT0_9BILA|nr:unnamed protein product [Adineta steineri]